MYFLFVISCVAVNITFSADTSHVVSFIFIIPVPFILIIVASSRFAQFIVNVSFVVANNHSFLKRNL